MRNYTAILVDQDIERADADRLVLEDRGYIVVTADNVNGCRKYEGQKFDIAIVDGLEGRCFEVFEILNVDMKVIISGNDETLREAKCRGIRAYPNKIKVINILEDIENAGERMEATRK